MGTGLCPDNLNTSHLIFRPSWAASQSRNPRRSRALRLRFRSILASQSDANLSGNCTRHSSTGPTGLCSASQLAPQSPACPRAYGLVCIHKPHSVLGWQSQMPSPNLSRPIVGKGEAPTKLALGADSAAAHPCMPQACKARRSRGSDGGPSHISNLPTRRQRSWISCGSWLENNPFHCGFWKRAEVDQ